MHGSKARGVHILDRYLKEIGPLAREIRIPAVALRNRIAQSDTVVDASRAVPFVGRETYLEHLNAALALATSSHGSLQLIWGEPGIGKTRLVRETGTAAGKDARFFEACGARPVLDFTSAGYPSTYMLSLEELLGIYNSILGHLRAANPDYIILEIADGIFQRETRMMLGSELLPDSVDHVFFAASDSLSAEHGVRSMREYGLPVRAIAGSVTQSPLASREAEEAVGMPCMSIERIMDGTLKEVLGTGRALQWSARDDIFAPTDAA
jgi:hypothetical protein